MTKYTWQAIVNYPEQTDVQSPDFECRNDQMVLDLIGTLLNNEPDATSYVVTIVRHRDNLNEMWDQANEEIAKHKRS